MKKELKKQFAAMGYVISSMSEEDWEVLYLGASAGVIDGSMIDKTIFEKIGELESWELSNPFKVLPAWIPSSSAVKKAFLELNKKKESDLEKKYYYLLSKSTIEFIVYINAEVKRHGSMALAYAAAAGLLSITSKNAGKIADNAIARAKSDLKKLKDVTSIKDLVKQIPNKYKVNLKCKEFANNLEQLMKNNSVSGERIFIKSKTDFIVSDRHGTISYNGNYDAIKAGNTVYDNLNPNGINYNEWVSDLGINDFPSIFDISSKSIR